MRSWIVVALALAACSDHKQAAPPEPVAAVASSGDAGVRPVPGAASNPGAHLDDDVGPRPAPPTVVGHRGAIDITLRSSPSGAMAAVDGVPVGATPTFWNGTADGRPHDFTFTRSGYAFARYRFVPITSGVVHARLEPIGEDGDAGVPPAPEPAAPAPFTPAAPPAAPPPDAAPRPTPPTRDDTSLEPPFGPRN